MNQQRCKACGKLLPVQQGRGRHRQYCNDACQQEAYRERKGGEKRNKLLRFSPLDLIYCAGDNERLTRIAHEAGFLIGIRSGRTAHGFPVKFVDIEYRKPNFHKHLLSVRRHWPKYATVLDLSEEVVSAQDVARALAQYEELSYSCEIPLIVPKLPGQIALLPGHIAIGYSVPTSYGGARYPLWELEGRRVHLLGGSPDAQMEIYKGLSTCAQVMSADGNMAQKMATQFAKFWQNGVWMPHPDRNTNTPDLYLDCWQRSCTNIRRAWQRLTELASTSPLAREESRVSACDKEVADAIEIPA